MATAYQASWASGVTVQFRMLTWVEFRHAAAMPVPAAVRDLWVYQKVKLAGPEPEETPAGILHWLGTYLVDQSPFRETADLVKKFRYLATRQFEGSYLKQASALIAATFRYTFEEIEHWDQEQFFERLIAAEMLVGKRMEPVSQGPSESEQTGAPAGDPMEEQMRAQDQARSQQKAALRKHLKEKTDRRRMGR